MAEVKMFYDEAGQTLTVWFTDRAREYLSLIHISEPTRPY